jgi:serine-type D-Ala-D-Ala carboxypeptidase/endopeptidase
VDQYKQAVGMVAFVVDEKGARYAAHGSQNANQNIPISPDTLFEIGSITKTFTGLLLADMVVRGVVKLEDPVERYLPDNLPLRDSGGAQIRLIDLATHRSGLSRLPPDFSPRDTANPYADYDEKSLLTSLRDLDKSGRPLRDAKHEYSNFGFGILGYVLGRAEGTNYSTALQKRVLDPLGMSATFFVAPASAQSRFSDGHDEKLKVVPHWDFDALAGAGALRMSARDLARYAQAALGLEKSPLSAAFALATQLHGQTANKANTIGLGWVRGKLNGRDFLNHDGSTYGFSSTLWLDTTRKIATGVITNTFASVNDIGLHALESSIPPTDFSAKSQPSVVLTAAALTEVVGIYRLSPAMDITISARGNQLFAQATGQGEFELFAQSNTKFFAKVAPIMMEFAERKDGKAPNLLLIQSGQKMLAPRVP